MLASVDGYASLRMHRACPPCLDGRSGGVPSVRAGSPARRPSTSIPGVRRLPVEGPQGVQRTGVQVEPAGRGFPAVHGRDRDAELFGEPRDGEAALPAQPGHPIAGGSDISGRGGGPGSGGILHPWGDTLPSLGGWGRRLPADGARGCLAGESRAGGSGSHPGREPGSAPRGRSSQRSPAGVSSIPSRSSSPVAQPTMRSPTLSNTAGSLTPASRASSRRPTAAPNRSDA